jgi:antitoxin component YwqK of YwqJK toxin-antitoxin module
MNTAFEVPFLFRGRMFRNALQLVSGDKLYITGSSGYTIAEYFEKAFGINYEDVEEGCNVITFSLAIALAMKCDPIILVGVDLAYSDNQAYAPGMVSHPLHKKFRTKVESDDLIYRKDINGNVVPTLWKWITESLWFTDFSARNPSLRLINATEGGIGFVNIPNMTLAEVADKFLTRSYAIETRLSGEIQSHKMPSAVTFECVYSLCQELFESLARAEKELDQYAHELFEKLKDNDENELSLEEFKEALHQKIANRLQKEAGYEYLLKGFDLAFDQLKSRDYMRLSMDQTIIPPKSLRHYLIELEIERMQFLQQTAAINNALIQNALLEQTRKNTPVEVPQDALIVFDASDYSYDKDLLRIIDPECDLNVSQEFIPDPVSGAFRLYYPDGSLKLESYYKDAKLHGPSRFYSDQGQLLSESWFLDGRKEGKAKGFSLEGNLVFIQRFKHGLKRGKQEYFYENQIPRMVLTYSDQGELDGDVILYHPNGVMARKLHFTNGKRNGVEHLWDTQGQLTIEAHFNHNLPTGSAKIWYPSGQLAQETVYDEVTGEPTVSSWKEDGTPIGASSKGHSDYFQDVAKSSKELTKNLNTVFKEVTVLAPLLNQLHVAGVDVDGTNGTEPDLQSLAKDLSMIGEAIGNLQKLNTDLIKEAGLEERTQGEAFWKTASLQREVEQKLHEATAMMQWQLDVLRGTLATTIQAIKIKLNKQKK